MLQTHASRAQIKQHMTLTLLFGLTTWLILPPLTVLPVPQKLGVTARSPAPVLPSHSYTTAPDEASRARVEEAYGLMPLSFEANEGQTEEQVKFLARGVGYSLFLTSSEAVLSLQTPGSTNIQIQPETAIRETPRRDNRRTISSRRALAIAPSVLRLQFIGANQEPQVTGLEKQAGRSHYFIGRERQHWRTNVPHYGKVIYKEVYRGVDMVYYGKGQQLEYDFVVAAGADPGVIKLSFAGAQQLKLDGRGDLVLGVTGGELRQPRPVVYQEICGVRKEISSHYVLRQRSDLRLASPDSFEVGIAVGNYDVSRELVIDPKLDYSTYLGGSGDDEGHGIAVDGRGNAYVTGFTDSADFPTEEASQLENAGGVDAFVTKLSRDGDELVYSTYLGGSEDDEGRGIAVDGRGNAYVTGGTASTDDFPITEEAFQPENAGGDDAFVAKLSRDGDELVYSTYLGGSEDDAGEGIAVDGKGNTYVTGDTESTDFPTEDPFQSENAGVLDARDAFVTKLSRDGGELVYSTYLGGSGGEEGRGIAVNDRGNAYVTGFTDSMDFPTEEAFQSENAGGEDAFVTKLSRDGGELVYSTYLGGSEDDEGRGIALGGDVVYSTDREDREHHDGRGTRDGEGNAYVTGFTLSTDFPLKKAFQRSYAGGSSDAFVTKLNRNGQELVYSTYLGGSGLDEGRGIAVNGKGNAYVTGFTDSINFPTEEAFQSENAGGEDAFVTKLSRDGKELDYSTYFGGSEDDEGLGIALDRDVVHWADLEDWEAHARTRDGKDDVYVTGFTFSPDLRTKRGFQRDYAGGEDAFVTKIENDERRGKEGGQRRERSH